MTRINDIEANLHTCGCDHDFEVGRCPQCRREEKSA